MPSVLETYRGRIRDGDEVRMEDGTLAVVKRWDIVCGGNAMVARLRPKVNPFRRFWMALHGRTTLYDEQIDRLTLVTPSPHPEK